jgi:hypothetical protein
VEVSLDPGVRKERDFLALCVASPPAGQRALAQIDPETHITSVRLRRAARHLAGRLDTPLSGLAPEDEELARVLADVVEQAGRVGAVRPEQIEQQRLYLELGRLERAIRRARVAGRGNGDGDAGGGEGAPVRRLALERERVLASIRELDARMERPV